MFDGRTIYVCFIKVFDSLLHFSGLHQGLTYKFIEESPFGLFMFDFAQMDIWNHVPSKCLSLGRGLVLYWVNSTKNSVLWSMRRRTPLK